MCSELLKCITAICLATCQLRISRGCIPVENLAVSEVEPDSQPIPIRIKDLFLELFALPYELNLPAISHLHSFRLLRRLLSRRLGCCCCRTHFISPQSIGQPIICVPHDLLHVKMVSQPRLNVNTVMHHSVIACPCGTESGLSAGISSSTPNLAGLTSWFSVWS